jgi:polysaccharide chain length determinant protein (PEP-CTERM system associated)
MSGDRPNHAAPAGEQDDSGDAFQWTQFRHFLHAPLRRPLLVTVPWAAIVLVSIAALLVLPKKYMSSALVLVESEKMPESFIPKVSTRDAGQRLEAVRPEILSRTRLERVLDETRPYPGLGKTQAVERMRSAIFIALSSNDGFTISFYHRDPLKAQEVTDRLARLFIDETIKSRTQQVEGAVDFLVTQVNDARVELEKKDAALRRFKEEHMGKLPEQLATNLASMQMLQHEMQTVEESLLFSREKQEALARGIGRSASAAQPQPLPASSELDELNRQLASLTTRYKDAHPDVESLRSRIARLEARLAEARRADTSSGTGSSPGDPSSLVAREQLDRANLEVKSLERRRDDLQSKAAVIRANVEDTPRTEQELANLTRDYKKLDENYTALLSKQLEAQMSGRLERRWKGERFRMLDPASLPEKPVFPKPTLFLGLGAFLGLCVGLGASLVAEYLDPTVKDSEILQAVQGYPVLAVIPHVPDNAGSVRPRPSAVEPVTAHAPDVARGEREKAWRASVAGEAPFRDDGSVTPRRVVPVIESLEDRDSIVGEELRLFGANLLNTCRRLKVTCLALTSALPGEGKSTLSVGLASALGREPGRRILLIETDLRRPSLTKTLGLPPAHGLSEWLNGTLDYVPIRTVDSAGFFLVSAGQTPLKRPELLGSPRMEAVLRAARRFFDFVLLDAVPVLPVADTVLMQDLVDGFALVVRSRRTPREAIHDTLGKLRSDRVIGVVFNGHQEYRGSHKYYGYHSYGMAAQPSPPGRVARLLEGLKARRQGTTTP